MNQLFPIIRRVRRSLLPPEEARLIAKFEPPSPQPSPPGEGEPRVAVELPPSLLPATEQPINNDAKCSQPAPKRAKAARA